MSYASSGIDQSLEAAHKRIAELESKLHDSEKLVADFKAWKGLLKDGDYQAYAEIQEQHSGLVARVRELETEIDRLENIIIDANKARADGPK